MMKKALAYAMTAILLGAVIMLAPWMLVKLGSYVSLGSGGEENVLPRCAKGEETLGGQGYLERVIGLPNLSSAGLMLIPSFLLALGVSLYFKKRMF